ncbi:MAG TPA: glycosyltransferase family 2 protein [Dehalococcoidia bacterium]
MTQDAAPDISIVIVNYNAWPYLERCLRSLQAHAGAARQEIIVVDNASEDGSPALVARHFPGVRLIARADNGGFARGCNDGIRAARGRAICLLNPDTEVRETVFDAAVRYLDGHPDVAVLGPRILNPDGSLQLSCRRFPGFAAALFNRYSLATRLFPNNPFSRRYLMTDWSHDAVADVDWISGACMVLSRRALDEIGLLDEGYFMYIEDVDLCQRAHRAGYRVVYFPEVSVYHHIGVSAQWRTFRSVLWWHQSMWHYYLKYMRRNVLLDVATFAGIWGRCGLKLALVGARQLRSPRRAVTPSTA